MSKSRIISLEAVRTDGWFERIGQGIGSFRALCDIVGERFFAFSMITGARITSLTVDRRDPDGTLVDFVVGGEGEDDEPEEQRLALPDFRRRLVAALVMEGPLAPPPVRETDLEAIQLHIGVRYLLLAPLYGYSLRALQIEKDRSIVHLLLDGVEASFELSVFQQRLRAHVREELSRATSDQRSTIDLSHVAEAEAAATLGDWSRVVQLLGTWPAPLAIFLRTPEGQSLALETSSLIAKGLGLLGSACVEQGEVERAEDVFRLGVQYAHDGQAAADIFERFGEAVLSDGRAGEAIGLLRRAAALGAPAEYVQLALAQAFRLRRRFVAAWACLRAAERAGAEPDLVQEEQKCLQAALGEPLEAWQKLVCEQEPPSSSIQEPISLGVGRQVLGS